MMLKNQQKPLSIKKQIENIKDIGLIVENEPLAASFLNNVSYFRFIKAYSLGLKCKNNTYNNGVTFNGLKELYLFDTQLRHLIFLQIEHLEVSLRCRISNYFSINYGPLAYNESCNFANQNYHASFILEVKKEINRNRCTPFIHNFQENYVNGSIPLYALVEILSFGTLSKFYKNLKNPDKKAISQTFDVPYTYLESWIESFAYVRNICAHYGRLYNAKLAKTPKLYPNDRKKGIVNNRIFGILVCMAYILKNNTSWQSFVTSTEELFIKYPLVKKETMGFPGNWKEIL